MPPRTPALIFGLAMLGFCVFLAVAIANPYLRFGGGLTAFAIGFGAIRHAFRIE